MDATSELLENGESMLVVSARDEADAVPVSMSLGFFALLSRLQYTGKLSGVHTNAELLELHEKGLKIAQQLYEGKRYNRENDSFEEGE